LHIDLINNNAHVILSQSISYFVLLMTQIVASISEVASPTDND